MCEVNSKATSKNPISPESKGSEWNRVVTPKPNAPEKIRMCVDMRAANTAIERERHITPAVDDIIGQLHGS